jgi:hypothetical protein
MSAGWRQVFFPAKSLTTRDFEIRLIPQSAGRMPARALCAETVESYQVRGTLPLPELPNVYEGAPGLAGVAQCAIKGLRGAGAR